MTAEPVVTVVIYENGERTALSVEWSETACCELRVVEQDVSAMTVIPLSKAAAVALATELLRFAAQEEE